MLKVLANPTCLLEVVEYTRLTPGLHALPTWHAIDSDRPYPQNGWSFPEENRQNSGETQTCAGILLNKEGKSAINLSNLPNFCQIWPWAIYSC